MSRDQWILLIGLAVVNGLRIYGPDWYERRKWRRAARIAREQRERRDRR